MVVLIWFHFLTVLLIELFYQYGTRLLFFESGSLKRNKTSNLLLVLFLVKEPVPILVVLAWFLPKRLVNIICFISREPD